MEGVMTGCVPRCLGKCTTASGCYYRHVKVNDNRYLQKNPAISLSELTNKHLQMELERISFPVLWCTVPQKLLSPFFTMMNTFLIFIVTV